MYADGRESMSPAIYKQDTALVYSNEKDAMVALLVSMISGNNGCQYCL